MNAWDEIRYRLELARGYLREAESDCAEAKWHGCLANAQEAVENAGKAIISTFAPVPKTHDVARQLAELVQREQLPGDLRDDLESMIPEFGRMGLATHIRVTYGDEETFTPPWELIEQPEAEAGLERARHAIALAEKFRDRYSQ